MSKMASREPFGHLQHKLWSKEGPGVKLAVWFPTAKSWNWPDPGVCRWSATHRWKALKENYKFALDLLPIEGLSKKLWTPKVLGVQIGTISGFHFGSPGKKCHSNVSAAERHKKYYMGEGGGFPWVRVVVSQMNPRLPVACSNSKSVQNEFQPLCGWFDANSSKWIRLVTLPSPNPRALARPSTPLVLRVRERAPTPSLFPLFSTWDSFLSPSRSWGCVTTTVLLGKVQETLNFELFFHMKFNKNSTKSKVIFEHSILRPMA
jgi:hypothetical protein